MNEPRKTEWNESIVKQFHGLLKIILGIEVLLLPWILSLTTLITIGVIAIALMLGFMMLNTW